MIVVLLVRVSLTKGNSLDQNPLNLNRSTNGLIDWFITAVNIIVLWYVTLYKNIIVLGATYIGSLGRLKLDLHVRVAERIWRSDEKGALSPAPHYRSCQPPSTNMRGPTVAWGPYWALVSAAQRWLILYSYHFAPWEPQLLSPCHHTDSVAATLQFLPSQSSLWQDLSLVLRPGGSWGWGSVALRAAATSGLLCMCSIWRCSHCLWNAVLGVLD